MSDIDDDPLPEGFPLRYLPPNNGKQVVGGGITTSKPSPSPIPLTKDINIAN